MVAPFAVASAERETQSLPTVYPNQLWRDQQADSPPHASPKLLFLCCVFKWLMICFIFISFFLLVIRMIPRVTIPAMSVASASLSAFTFSATNTSVSADCNITLVLTNSNRHLTASHERMEVSLFYAASQQVPLSKFHHPRIVQPTSSRIALQSNLSFSGVDLGSGVVSAIKQEMDRGSLGLAVKISSVVKYTNRIWKTKTHHIRGYCRGVSFGFNSSNRPGSFLNPYQECEVYVSL